MYLINLKSDIFTASTIRVSHPMLRNLLLCFALFLCMDMYAQKYSSEKGKISFFSDAAVEDIYAENTLVGSLLNISTGDIVYIIKIKDFRFAKALMREHFNEKYMEIEKFPKSQFQGKINGLKANTLGIQNVTATGKLLIHGVTREVQIPGTFEFVNGKGKLKCGFLVRLNDYGIKIPTLVWQNIAEEIEVNVEVTYKAI